MTKKATTHNYRLKKQSKSRQERRREERAAVKLNKQLRRRNEKTV